MLAFFLICLFFHFKQFQKCWLMGLVVIQAWSLVQFKFWAFIIGLFECWLVQTIRRYFQYFQKDFCYLQIQKKMKLLALSFLALFRQFKFLEVRLSSWTKSKCCFQTECFCFQIQTNVQKVFCLLYFLIVPLAGQSFLYVQANSKLTFGLVKLAWFIELYLGRDSGIKSLDQINLLLIQV